MKEHAVSKCRECIEYPCEKIEDMLRRSEIKEEECHKSCMDEAEWQMLKRAFYEKEKHLEQRKSIALIPAMIRRTI
jgi:hypothetical protein